MASLKSRVQALEQAAPKVGPVHAPGAKTVRFEDKLRDRSFMLEHGFDLERIDDKPAPEPRPVDLTKPAQFVPLRDREAGPAQLRDDELRKKFRERIKGLGRDDQTRLATEHGYRIVFAKRSG